VAELLAIRLLPSVLVVAVACVFRIVTH
jgi:hypothetical protein